MTNKQGNPLFLSEKFPIFFWLMPSLNSYAFLRFLGVFFCIMLLFEIIIDLLLNFQFSMNHIFLKIAVYFSMLIPNVALLILFKIDPLKNLIIQSSFLIGSFLLRLSTYNVNESFGFNFEVIFYCLFSFPLYSVFILLIPNPKFRVLLVFLQQIAIVLFLNLMWTLNLHFNLKLTMSLVINFVIFWKTSKFSLQNTHKITKTPTKTPTKTISITQLKLPIQNDWKSLLEDIPEGLILISHDKNVLYSNQSSLELLDLDSKTVSKMPSFDFYQTIVSKLGKMEEIQRILGNLEEKKSAECGFAIMESSLSEGKRNSRKKSCLGVNPVNIYSSSVFQSKFKTTSPASQIFGKCLTKDRPLVDGNFNINPISPGINLGDKVKVIEKSENSFDGFSEMLKLKKETGEASHSGFFDDGKNTQNNYSMSENINFERNLDEIIEIMISAPTKMIKIFHSQNSENKKKKLELKIKKISFEDSLAFLLTIQDVSYLKFFQQVCENNEYKNKVLTTLSHELRTPLNGALIPLEKLLNESLDDSCEMFEDLDIIYKSIILLQNVLNDVVDFALINSNQLYLNFEELDIYKFFDNIVELFQRQAQEKKLFLDLIFDSPNKIPRILKTDFQRLGQILVSLLNNSMKNTFEGGISLHVDAIEKL